MRHTKLYLVIPPNVIFTKKCDPIYVKSLITEVISLAPPKSEENHCEKTKVLVNLGSHTNLAQSYQVAKEVGLILCYASAERLADRKNGKDPDNNLLGE